MKKINASACHQARVQGSGARRVEAGSDATMISFIVARVAPTKSLRMVSSSICAPVVSKSISVKMMQGADWPLKRYTESISNSPCECSGSPSRS